MAKEHTYKHPVLQKGGQYDDTDGSVESWLDFLTNPENLSPGLPNLTLAVGEWNVFFIHVSFATTRASLRSFTVELNSFDDSEVPFFRDPHAPDAIPNGTAFGANPHHLKSWVFALFQHTEIERLEIPFLCPELPDLFDQLPKLKYVSLKNSKLVRLPPSFYKLPALDELDIVGSSLPELPPELTALPSLHRLAFDQPFAPAVLGSLSRLTHLQCYCPDLQVPRELMQLTNLESLQLASIAGAPEDLLNFPHLQWLNFQVSKFTRFRFQQGNMPSLSELTTNSLEVFSTALAGFENLQKLTASGKIYPSDMEPLKLSFARLGKLARLSLNRLHYFNEQKGLFTVRYHDLDFFSTLNSLAYLNLNENGLSRMPLISDLQNLKELHLRHNYISEFHELPPSLEYLDLGKNDFVHIRSDLSYLQKMKTLLLNNNRIVDFATLPNNLESLNLDGNQIVDIPAGLSYLLKLNTLCLHNNLLTVVPQLPFSLLHLDLSKNAIVRIPLGLGKLQKLKTLKLSNNPIDDLPELPVMPMLEVLEMVGTKLPESEYSVTPTTEVIEKLERTFPYARLGHTFL